MFSIVTEYPIAYQSNDHTHPWGTKRDNFTNKKFINEISEHFGGKFNFLDLGCSGGQFVVDMMSANGGGASIGLEGSDYSVKHKRANWPKYHNKNLFTCDITKPFDVQNDGESVKFDLITAWEVLEHIPKSDLDAMFQNIYNHLSEDGIFACSVSFHSDKPNGVELHVTREKPPFWEEVFKRNGFVMVGDGEFGKGGSIDGTKYAHHYLFKYRLRGKTHGKCFWTTLKKSKV